VAWPRERPDDQQSPFGYLHFERLFTMVEGLLILGVRLIALLMPGSASIAAGRRFHQADAYPSGLSAVAFGAELIGESGAHSVPATSKTGGPPRDPDRPSHLRRPISTSGFGFATSSELAGHWRGGGVGATSPQAGSAGEGPRRVAPNARPHRARHAQRLVRSYSPVTSENCGNK
jgi:hypothetical protein